MNRVHNQAHRPSTDVRSVLAERRRSELAVTPMPSNRSSIAMPAAQVHTNGRENIAATWTVSAVHRRAAQVQHGDPMHETSMTPS